MQAFQFLHRRFLLPGKDLVYHLLGHALQMPPATRVYVLLLLIITAIDVMSGEAIDSGSTLSMSWERTFKVT